MSIKCLWEYNPDLESWNTECGDMFAFNDGGPIENGFNFFHHCGCVIDPGKHTAINYGKKPLK